MKGKTVILILVAVIVLLAISAGIAAAASYNGTVKLREQVDSAEAQVKNRLQQRHDKMPQLISAVEGLQEHAKSIYKMITDARAAYDSAKTSDDYIAADNLESQALTDLRVLIESNPGNITASAAYYAYMDEVSGMESALAIARKDYNDAVQGYNTAVKKFPRVLFVGLFGFEKELSYWEVDDGASEVPLNDFTD